MDQDNIKEGIKKIKFNNVTFHSFIKFRDLNYVLLIINYTTLRLINLANFQFKIMVQYKINHMDPIDITIQGHSNIYFLCKNSIYWCTLNEIINKRQPKKYDNLIGNDMPLRIICLKQTQWIIVFQSFLSFVDKGQNVKFCNYPKDMKFNKCIIDNEFQSKKDPFIMIPNSKQKFPCVFSLRQTQKWFEQNYLENYIKQCEKYYSEDQKLKSDEYIVAFSSCKKVLCICFNNELLVLLCQSKQSEYVDFFLKMRIKINMEWKNIPYSCAIEYSASPVLIYSDEEKVCCILPMDYVQFKRKIRQKQNIINHVYATSQKYFFLISSKRNGQQMKLYLAKF